MLSSADILHAFELIGWTVIGILILCGIYVALRYQEWRDQRKDQRHSSSQP